MSVTYFAMNGQPFVHSPDDCGLGAICNEATGTHYRMIYYVEPTVKLEDFLWERMHGLPSMFGIVPLVDRDRLRRLWDRNLMWLMVDDVGIVGFDLTTRAMPNIHVTFWDKRMRGRELLGTELCNWALDYFQVPAIFTQAPAASKVTIAWAKRLGFKVSNWYSASVINAANELDDLVELSYRTNTTCTGKVDP